MSIGSSIRILIRTALISFRKVSISEWKAKLFKLKCVFYIKYLKEIKSIILTDLSKEKISLSLLLALAQI